MFISDFTRYIIIIEVYFNKEPSRNSQRVLYFSYRAQKLNHVRGLGKGKYLPYNNVQGCELSH